MYIDFEYANKRASDFDCVVGHFNTDSGIQESDIGCDITFTTVKNKHSSVHSVTSSTYENVYTSAGVNSELFNGQRSSNIRRSK